MNTRKIIISIFLLILYNVSAQNTDIDLMNANPIYELKKSNKHSFNGNVKSITNLVYEPVEKFGEITKGKIISPLSEDNFKIEYNNFGLITKRILFDKDGKTIYNTTFEYDNINNLIEVKRINSNDKTTLLEKFSYDNKGNRIKAYSKYGGISENKLEYEYNKNSQLINLKTNNGLESENYKYSYIYSNNKISEVIVKTTAGEIKSRKKLSYLGNNISQFKEYNSQNEIIETINFKYDIRNNLIYKSVLRNNQNTSYEYSYQFNDKNDITAKITNEYKVTFAYKYDNNNNWISKIRYHNGFPEYLIIREIIYM